MYNKWFGDKSKRFIKKNIEELKTCLMKIIKKKNMGHPKGVLTFTAALRDSSAEDCHPTIPLS